MTLPAIAPLRQSPVGTLRAARRAAATIPLTIALIATLLTALTILDAHPESAPATVAWTSTNLQNLASHPVAALLTSMFVISGHPWLELTLLAASCGLVERRLGAARTVAIALAGQVIATLLTESGAAALSHLNLIVTSSPTRPDVGVSYVTAALLCAATLLLPSQLRAPALATVAGVTVYALAVAPGMTTAGHLLSLGCGALALRAVTARPYDRPPETSRTAEEAWR